MENLDQLAGVVGINYSTIPNAVPVRFLVLVDRCVELFSDFGPLVSSGGRCFLSENPFYQRIRV